MQWKKKGVTARLCQGYHNHISFATILPLVVNIVVGDVNHVNYVLILRDTCKYRRMYQIVTDRLVNADGGPVLNQHWINIGCLLILFSDCVLIGGIIMIQNTHPIMAWTVT